MVQSPGASLRTCCAFSVVLVLLISLSVSATPLVRSYVWEFSGRSWTLDFTFDANDYAYYRGLDRTLPYTAYHAYVSEPKDDAVLREFVVSVDALGLDAGLNVWERLNLVIAFVQAIPYASEECEYPRYPLEMLIEGRGDCEDAAILAASLLRELGFGVVLLAFLEESHMALGVLVTPPGADGLQAYRYKGDLYYYLEPTSPGWAIGVVPPDYRSVPHVIDVLPAYAQHAN